MGHQTPVALIGAGLIGRSWALLFARSGCPIVVQDSDARALESARVWLEQRLGDATADIRYCTGIAEAVHGAGYIQESGPERLDVKRTIYREIEAAIGPDAMLGTSTSALEPDPLFDAPQMVAQARRAILPVKEVPARQEWRDRQIDALRQQKAREFSEGQQS